MIKGDGAADTHPCCPLIVITKFTIMAAYGFETLYQDRPKILPSSSSADTTLQHAQLALSQIISDNESDEVAKTKLGLSDSGRIALDIIRAAQVCWASFRYYTTVPTLKRIHLHDQRARSHREACTFIAEQAYQLVNAMDAGVKGGAIDVTDFVRDHVVRLNAYVDPNSPRPPNLSYWPPLRIFCRDLDEINNALKHLGSWWTFPRIWRSQNNLVRCHDILEQEMKLYILLIKCCLAQSERQDSMRKTYNSFVELTSDRPATWTHPLLGLNRIIIHSSRRCSQFTRFTTLSSTQHWQVVFLSSACRGYRERFPAKDIVTQW
jgi:hypothetical protein